jgi:hypothetical protein
MNSGPEKIIYILGGGHSGSTLLDLILGSTGHAFSVGEFMFLDYYKGYKARELARGRVCTCGEHFDACPFWSKIEFASKDNISKHDTFGESARILANVLNPFERWFRFRFHIGFNRDVYERVFDESRKLKPNNRFIVDSSKDPRRLYELIQDPDIGPDRLAVVHLIRDGRGYVYSYQKALRVDFGVKVRSTIVCLAEWIGINLFSRILIHKYNLAAYTLSYDQFAEDPTSSLDKLGEFLGIDLDGDKVLARIEKSVYHNVHGNPMRRRKIAAIRRDSAWVTNFSPVKRFVLSVVLYPFNRRWVYSRR